MSSQPTLICLMGPTASGKTDLAMRLAEHHLVEIVSVDSALVYKGMDIGTGKPNANMLEKAPHHLINVCDPAVRYNAGQFREDALKVIKEIISRNHIPLLVGGTMMYFKALLEGLAVLPPCDVKLRETLDVEAKMLGWPALHNRLASVDPICAARIKPTDAQRIQRALEVYILSNKSLSDWIKESHLKQDSELLPYQVHAIGFIPTMEQRKILHGRIEQRFLKMLEAGFLAEVEHLFERSDLNLDTPSMRCVGYRQVWEYLLGYYNYETMKEKAMAATRQLAKRQITWLRSWPALIEIDFFNEKVTLDHCDKLIAKLK